VSELIREWSDDYADYLRDESRRTGAAESISFPVSESEVVAVVGSVASEGRTITTQGARTGIVAGAVPGGGHVLNLSRMARIGPITMDEETGEARIAVEPGVILSDLRETIARRSLFFPPDPTETSASIGGMVACNASGALTLHYGPTRDWVRGLRAVLADGDVIALPRGEVRAQGREFEVKTERGRTLSGTLPGYTQPGVKSAAGYFVTDDMDMIDLFIGSEGTLGVITEIELALIPAPRVRNGLTVFVPSEHAALKLVRAARGESVDGVDVTESSPCAIEFFNSDAVDLLRRMKSENPAFEKIPAIRPDYHTAVYLEFHGADGAEVEESVMSVMSAVEALGGSDDDTWFADSEREMESLKAFRHAIPEAVNLLIDERRRSCPEITKLGTDMSVPDERLEDVLEMYRAGLSEAGLESVVFGHIGNNHVHVNILPRNNDEYEAGKSLYMSWARKIVEMGGSVSAEHGIGKLKAPFLALMYGDDAIAEMRALRSVFDPAGALNPGNLF